MSDTHTPTRQPLPEYTVDQEITVQGRKLVVQRVELDSRGVVLYVRKLKGSKTQMVTHSWNDKGELMPPRYTEINW